MTQKTKAETFVVGGIVCLIEDARSEIGPLYDQFINATFLERSYMTKGSYSPPQEVVIQGRNAIVEMAHKLLIIVDKFDERMERITDKMNEANRRTRNKALENRREG